MCREDIACDTVATIGVAGGDIRVDLACSEIYNVKRIHIFTVKTFDALTVVVGMTQDIFLQHPCADPDSENKAEELDRS